MADVGRRVMELRQSRGWTQEHFAERLRVDARTLQRIEAGKHITFAMLVQLARALRVPIGELFEPPTARDLRRRGRPVSVSRRPEPVATESKPPRPTRRAGKRS